MMFEKKKANEPVTVHLVDAHKRAEPIPFTLNSTDLTGLLFEAIQLGKLIVTEERDLEAIRSDHDYRTKRLQGQYDIIMADIQKFYGEREKTIDGINAHADMFIKQGQHEIAKVLLCKLIDMVANNSPLRTVMELKGTKLLT